MTTYNSRIHNIFEDVEFTLQDKPVYSLQRHLFKNSYQLGGNIFYEEEQPNHINTSDNTKNTKFLNSCKKHRTMNQKEPCLLIGGFHIQL